MENALLVSFLALFLAFQGLMLVILCDAGSYRIEEPAVVAIVGGDVAFAVSPRDLRDGEAIVVCAEAAKASICVTCTIVLTSSPRLCTM